VCWCFFWHLAELNRRPEQQKAIDELIEQLHDQNSPQHHRWLTASQIAERFGAAEEDIKTVTDWLASHGFIVNGVYRADGVIDFSGSAAQVFTTFHTQIHNLDVHGTRHIANTSEPQIPAAFATAIRGVVSLNDFRPHSMGTRQARPNYTVAGNFALQLVTPGDFRKNLQLGFSVR
jgi:subtilase family serine protease